MIFFFHNTFMYFSCLTILSFSVKFQSHHKICILKFSEHNIIKHKKVVLELPYSCTLLIYFQSLSRSTLAWITDIILEVNEYMSKTLILLEIGGHENPPHIHPNHQKNNNIFWCILMHSSMKTDTCRKYNKIWLSLLIHC